MRSSHNGKFGFSWSLNDRLVERILSGTAVQDSCSQRSGEDGLRGGLCRNGHYGSALAKYDWSKFGGFSWIPSIIHQASLSFDSGMFYKQSVLSKAIKPSA
jgi:hypothetical protein